MTNIDEIKARAAQLKHPHPTYFSYNAEWAAKTILELCGEVEMLKKDYETQHAYFSDLIARDNKIIVEKDAEIENLKKQVEDLKLELDEARDPVHCNLCGSCGVDMCCPAHGCAHPHIKSETLKEQSETILELYNELKEKDQVLAWYGDEGVYNWHYSDDKRTTTTTDVQEDFGKRAREVIQKYKVSEG